MRLLAVRLAGAAFNDRSRLCSPAFEQVVAKHEKLQRESAALRSRVLSRLFELIPHIAESRARRIALDIKRAVFNGRVTPRVPSALPPDVRQALSRLNALVHRDRELFESTHAAILCELRMRLRDALADSRFRLACRYTSPSLAAKIDSAGMARSGDLTPLERGIYSYAARFMSKANPYHLFGAISLAGHVVSPPHEIVLDARYILKLEALLLPHAAPHRVWMCLAPVYRRGSKLEFWIESQRQLRLAVYDSNDNRARAIEFFRDRRRATGVAAGTRRDWRRYVDHTASEQDASGLDAALLDLIGAGVVQQYLITDFRRASHMPTACCAASDRRAAGALGHHLHYRKTTELADVHDDLEQCRQAAGGQTQDGPGFFVNTYAAVDTRPLHEILAPVLEQLAHLKPLFGSSAHNFRHSDHVMRSYISAYFRHLGANQAPYLDILRQFLRHREEFIRRYRPDPPASSGGHRTWRESLAAMEGDLGRKDVDAFNGRLRTSGSRRSLCFVGTFDALRRLFFVSNIFAGNGRYVGRYLLNRTRQEREAVSLERTDEDVLDVDVAVPPHPNINYVVPTFAVGCGFHARWAHRYDRWISPCEVVLREEGRRVVYLLDRTGEVMRPHYRGFQLAQQLPTQYQFLLLDHADAYENPFLRAPAKTPAQDVVHHPELKYGHVCLRREAWEVSRDFLNSLAAERDSIRFAVNLRDALHRRLDRRSDYWYYAFRDEPHGGLGKPRFLDLKNPLSAMTFRHGFHAVDGACTFTEMAPGPAAMLKPGGEPRVSELMLEV